MRIMLLNPNTTEAMTRDMEAQARRCGRSDTQIDGFTPGFGAPSIEGHYEEEFSIMSFLQTIRAHRADYDGVMLACYGDPGL